MFAIGDGRERSAFDYVELVERGSFDLRIVPELTRAGHARGIDIVHAHEYKTDLLALVLARRTGVVPLATAHGWTGHSTRERRLYYPSTSGCWRGFRR